MHTHIHDNVFAAFGNFYFLTQLLLCPITPYINNELYLFIVGTVFTVQTCYKYTSRAAPYS